MYSEPHFRADIRRLQALAFIPKAQKNIVVVFVPDERKANDVMFITVR
jgi:hypothetical protein